MYPPQTSKQLMNLLAFVGLIAIVIGMFVYFVSQFLTSTRNIIKSQGIDYQSSSEDCDVNYDNNPDISNLPCCKDLDGNITSIKYVSVFDMVVSRVRRPYLSVCAQFCKNGVSEDQSACNNFNDGSDIDIQQQKFEQCIKLTKPTDCVGSVKPVAYQGSVRYYAYAATDSLCKNTGTCAN